MWWLLPTMFACALTEVIGWSGRLWSSINPRSLSPYLMQSCCTVLAPSFMTAALFIILGKITTHLGTQYARLRPNVYSVLFITMDIIALIIQSVGGAKASLALTNDGDPEVGARIMVSGIVFQIFAITLYVLTAAEFFVRRHYNKPIGTRQNCDADGVGILNTRPRITKKIWLMLTGMGIATVFLYIRLAIPLSMRAKRN
ncbi:hypothetical protein FRC03_010334 [Tulasnella sp. 419]|nr:hypothetical protein FRC03_010334 [Tulasnella sp. 419]